MLSEHVVFSGFGAMWTAIVGVAGVIAFFWAVVVGFANRRLEREVSLERAEVARRTQWLDGIELLVKGDHAGYSELGDLLDWPREYPFGTSSATAVRIVRGVEGLREKVARSEPLVTKMRPAWEFLGLTETTPNVDKSLTEIRRMGEAICAAQAGIRNEDGVPIAELTFYGLMVTGARGATLLRQERDKLAGEIGTPPEGSHPDEAKPRAETWHKERQNWIAEVAALRGEPESWPRRDIEVVTAKDRNLVRDGSREPKPPGQACLMLGLLGMAFPPAGDMATQAAVILSVIFGLVCLLFRNTAKRAERTARRDAGRAEERLKAVWAMVRDGWDPKEEGEGWKILQGVGYGWGPDADRLDWLVKAIASGFAKQEYQRKILELICSLTDPKNREGHNWLWAAEQLDKKFGDAVTVSGRNAASGVVGIRRQLEAHEQEARRFASDMGAAGSNFKMALAGLCLVARSDDSVPVTRLAQGAIWEPEFIALVKWARHARRFTTEDPQIPEDVREESLKLAPENGPEMVPGNRLVPEGEGKIVSMKDRGAELLIADPFVAEGVSYETSHKELNQLWLQCGAQGSPDPYEWQTTPGKVISIIIAESMEVFRKLGLNPSVNTWAEVQEELSWLGNLFVRLGLNIDESSVEEACSEVEALKVSLGAKSEEARELASKVDELEVTLDDEEAAHMNPAPVVASGESLAMISALAANGLHITIADETFEIVEFVPKADDRVPPRYYFAAGSRGTRWETMTGVMNDKFTERAAPAGRYGVAKNDLIDLLSLLGHTLPTAPQKTAEEIVLASRPDLRAVAAMGPMAELREMLGLPANAKWEKIVAAVRTRLTEKKNHPAYGELVKALEWARDGKNHGVVINDRSHPDRVSSPEYKDLYYAIADLRFGLGIEANQKIPPRQPDGTRPSGNRRAEELVRLAAAFMTHIEEVITGNANSAKPLYFEWNHVLLNQLSKSALREAWGEHDHLGEPVQCIPGELISSDDDRGVGSLTRPHASWSSFAKFVDDKFEWSKKTFGEGYRPEALIAHVRKELDEIERDPTDAVEWGDVVLLALDGLSRLGKTGDEISLLLSGKQDQNEEREWPPISEQVPGVPVEHVRDDKPGKAGVRFNTNDCVVVRLTEAGLERFEQFRVKLKADNKLQQCPFSMIANHRGGNVWEFQFHTLMKVFGDMGGYAGATSPFVNNQVTFYGEHETAVSGRAAMNWFDLTEGETPDAKFENFWKELVCYPGTDDIDLSALKKELSDYHTLLDRVPEILDYATGGRVTKPFVAVSAIKGEIDDEVERCIERAKTDGEIPNGGISRTDLRGAIARGWCYTETENRVMDPDLVESIAEELEKLLIVEVEEEEASESSDLQEEGEQVGEVMAFARESHPGANPAAQIRHVLAQLSKHAAGDRAVFDMTENPLLREFSEELNSLCVAIHPATRDFNSRPVLVKGQTNVPDGVYLAPNSVMAEAAEGIEPGTPVSLQKQGETLVARPIHSTDEWADMLLHAVQTGKAKPGILPTSLSRVVAAILQLHAKKVPQVPLNIPVSKSVTDKIDQVLIHQRENPGPQYEFEFNGTKCLVDSEDTPLSLYQRWNHVRMFTRVGEIVGVPVHSSEEKLYERLQALTSQQRAPAEKQDLIVDFIVEAAEGRTEGKPLPPMSDRARIIYNRVIELVGKVKRQRTMLGKTNRRLNAKLDELKQIRLECAGLQQRVETLNRQLNEAEAKLTAPVTISAEAAQAIQSAPKMVTRGSPQESPQFIEGAMITLLDGKTVWAKSIHLQPGEAKPDLMYWRPKRSADTRWGVSEKGKREYDQASADLIEGMDMMVPAPPPKGVFDISSVHEKLLSDLSDALEADCVMDSNSIVATVMALVDAKGTAETALRAALERVKLLEDLRDQMGLADMNRAEEILGLLKIDKIEVERASGQRWIPIIAELRRLARAAGRTVENPPFLDSCSLQKHYRAENAEVWRLISKEGELFLGMRVTPQKFEVPFTRWFRNDGRPVDHGYSRLLVMVDEPGKEVTP